MTSEPITRIRFLAAVAVLGGGLTLTACSSDSSDSSDGPGTPPGRHRRVQAGRHRRPAGHQGRGTRPVPRPTGRQDP